MFSIGTGAGTKFNVDIQSNVALLPDAQIQSGPVADALADLGHASSAFTPRPHAAHVDIPDVIPVHEQHEESEPDVPDPTLSAALVELQRLQGALRDAMSYGAGTNAKGHKCRVRQNSPRPSHILPEAWANMGNAQRAQAEEDIAATRQVLRAQIESLLTNFPN